MIYFIYTITNIKTGQTYIGFTKNPENRWKRHRNEAMDLNSKNRYYIHKAIYKHGIENFEFKIINRANGRAKIKALEIATIKEFKEKGIKLYNLTDGGDGANGLKYTRKQLKQMSERMKGRFDGDKNPFFGKRHTEETKKIISEKRKANAERDKHKYIGENHAHSKLTNKIVEGVCNLFLQNETMLSYIIAEKFEIKQGTVERILNGDTWSHISKPILGNKRYGVGRSAPRHILGRKIKISIMCQYCNEQFLVEKRELSNKIITTKYCSIPCRMSALKESNNKIYKNMKRNKNNQ